MRVLHVISSIDFRGGGPIVALAGMAEAQAAVGLEVTILASYQAKDSTQAAERLRQQGVNVTLIGPTYGRLRRHPDLKNIVEREVASADVVHIHAVWEEIQHQAAQAAIRADKPYILSCHGMLENWSLSQHWVRKKLYMAWRLRRNLNHAAGIHCTTATEYQMVAPLKLDSPSFVQALGLDLSEFTTLPSPGTFRQKYPQIGDRPMLLFLGRIHHVKGLDLLLPAFAKIVRDPAAKDAVLVLAGPDASGYRAVLQKIIDRENIADQVIFTGMLYAGDRVAALSDADLFVLPSSHENFGVAVVEAMAAGTPVIISDRVYIHDEVSMSGGGAVVPMEVEALSQTMLKWMKDHPLREEAGRRARRFAQEHYDNSVIARQWAGHYQRVVDQRRTQKACSALGAEAGAIAAPVRDASAGAAQGTAIATVPDDAVRVLHVISSVDPRSGGPAVALLTLANAQAAAGMKVSIVATWRPGFDRRTLDSMKSAGVEIRLIGPIWWRLARWGEIDAALREMVPAADVVHIHGVWEDIQHKAAMISRQRRVPYLVRPCGMLERWSLAQHWVRKHLYLKWRLKRDLDLAAAMHFTTEMEREMVAPLKVTSPSIIEPNGLDLTEFNTLPPPGTFRRKYPQIGSKRMVLFLSRIHHVKGLDLLLPAFAKVARDPAAKDVMLVLAGPDASGYQAVLEKIIEQEKLDGRVLFTGMLYSHDRVAALADADLFVLPSYHENFGVAVVEAMAAGAPVVISDRVYIHHEITGSGGGAVVPMDVDALARTILKWIADPALCKQAGEKGRLFVREHYNAEVIARHWVDRYRQLRAKSAPRAAALAP